MAKEVIMPALGMAQDTGTLLQWYKAEGESVTQGEPLMEIETDKVTAEIEAPASGTLANVTAQAGEEIPVGQPIALIVSPGQAPPPPPAESGAAARSEPTTEFISVPGQSALPASPVAVRLAEERGIDLSLIEAPGARIQKQDVLAYLAATERELGASASGPVLASPKARRLAREEGLELATLAGSGPDGAVLAADVMAAATAIRQQAPQVQSASDGFHTSRQWRVMAQRLTQSWATVPHFYLERDVVAAQLLDWRQGAMERISDKVTLTDLLVKVVATALRQHPRLYACWRDDRIVLNEAVNVGIAVDTEEGVVAPVFHAADEMDLRTLCHRRREMVDRVRAGKALPEDLQGGTFTISNLGMYGIDAFNAIIVPPQAAILAIGRVADRVVAVDGRPAVSPMVTLTLSCDHRVVDGATGALFMQTVARFIEDPIALLD